MVWAISALVCLGGMVATGSLSKSSAAMGAGAKTQMSNIFLAVMVLLVLAFLCAVVPMAARDGSGRHCDQRHAGFSQPRKWNADSGRSTRSTSPSPSITFLLVLPLDLLPAMIVGIVLSIIYMIYRISFPGRAVLGRVDENGDYEAITWQYGQRSGTTHSNAEPVPGVIVYRFGSPLIFSNAEAFKEHRRRRC